MFEFDQFTAGSADKASMPTEVIHFASGINRRSLLLWSEHCIECAAPECYQSCDLYKPRPDYRCRRFEYGSRRNTAYSGSNGVAAEIRFSQWGKLEARGNTVLVRRNLLNALENILYLVAPFLNLVGRGFHRLGGSSDWSALNFELHEILSRRLHRKSKADNQPDGFLIEIYNPSTESQYIKFECAVIRSRILPGCASPLPYWERLSLRPGYNRRILDYSSFNKIVNSGLPYKLSFTPEAAFGTHLIFISLDFVDFRATAQPADVNVGLWPTHKKSLISVAGVGTNVDPNVGSDSRPVAKCVVFDLDNTLWHGVLVEGEVTLAPMVMTVFKELDRRGILISVVSKNNEQDALDKLAQFGLVDYLIYPVINWARKSSNIKTIAKKISISTDSIIFVDDNEFEREEVSRADSSIEVLPETALETLLKHPRLAGSATTEAASRRVMYQQQIVRESALIEFDDDYLSFLKACRIVVTIAPGEENHRTRISELLQRTNQLNFSGTKYSTDSIVEIFDDNTLDNYVIHCRDKYGDYGLVGFALTSHKNNLVTVHDFMLSCRVQGKLIEKAFFCFLTNRYPMSSGMNSRMSSEMGRGIMEVNFAYTGVNDLAREVLREIGFTLSDTGPSILSFEPGSLDVDFLEIT